MQRKPLVIFLFALLCLTAAFVFRRTIYQIVILPLAYVWWWLTLYYRLLPQAAIWIVLIFIILFTTMRGLLLEVRWGWSKPLKKKKSQGPIESLAVLIQKSSEGNYYKWTIAQRLGRAARDLLDQREGSHGRKKIMRFSDRNWDAPREVSAYLEAGLNGTFADYPKRSWSRSPRTPLDVDPQQVIEYLESELENRNGHR
jgi:hypothetical protein